MTTSAGHRRRGGLEDVRTFAHSFQGHLFGAGIPRSDDIHRSCLMVQSGSFLIQCGGQLQAVCPFNSMMGLLGLARVTDQKLRVFDRAQFVALAGFDFSESLFRSLGGNFDEGLFCLNTLDGYEGWHGFKMDSL